MIPEAVRQELGTEIPAWLQVEEVRESAHVHRLISDLGKGEAEAIALALEKQPCTLIFDDKKARRIAGSLQLKLTGTLGVLVRAKELRLIESVRQLIQELEDRNFRFGAALKDEVLKLAGEQ
jgi:predicted nucleic acid-binding protein